MWKGSDLSEVRLGIRGRTEQRNSAPSTPRMLWEKLNGNKHIFFTNLFPLSTTEYMLMLNTEMWLLTPVLLEMDNSGWRSLWMQADTHLLHSPQGWNREIRGIRFSFKLSLLSKEFKQSVV